MLTKGWLGGSGEGSDGNRPKQASCGIKEPKRKVKLKRKGRY